jgi:2-dehydro-3-deoxygluconokinase
LHLSGLIAALSPDTAEVCLAGTRAEKGYDTKISFDLNYRASFWEGREAELRAAFTEIAALSDILVGNEEDFQLALGLCGPEAGGVGLSGKMESFKGMIGEAERAFPNVSVFATTLREVIDSNRHLWGAVMLSGGEWCTAEPREIGVLDRIGGGDGFVGGLLYGILRGFEPEKQLQFGWATGALAVTELFDCATPPTRPRCGISGRATRG